MIRLKEVKNQKQIKNPVLRQMVGYTSDDEIQFLFVVLENDKEKGVFIAFKTQKKELQTTYHGSHYLLPQAVSIYEGILQEKLRTLPKS